MKIDKTWLLTTLGSFLATVMGIVLTFGVSKLADMRNARELQKQCVYNALNDIKNVTTYLQRDSLYWSGWYPMLPDYIERHARKEKVPVDTISALFMSYFKVPTLFATRYEPVGKAIVESIPPASASDMQLHRYIFLAYEVESEVIALEDEYYKFYDRVNDINQKIDYSTKTYSSYEEYAEEFLSDDAVQRFARHLKYVCEHDIIGSYMKYLQLYKQIILQYSGITEEDYQKFSDEVDQKKVSSLKTDHKRKI